MGLVLGTPELFQLLHIVAPCLSMVQTTSLLNTNMHGHLPSSLLVELPGVVQCGVQEPGYDPPVPLFATNGGSEMVQVLVKSVPSSYVPIVLFFLNSVLVRGACS